MILFYFFFCSTGVWTQGLTLARKVLCCLNHSTSPSDEYFIRTKGYWFLKWPRKALRGWVLVFTQTPRPVGPLWIGKGLLASSAALRSSRTLVKQPRWSASHWSILKLEMCIWHKPPAGSFSPGEDSWKRHRPASTLALHVLRVPFQSVPYLR
jgi:hypothetical protein